MLELRERELNRLRVAEAGNAVDDRSSGIAKAEQLRRLVESFSGSVIASVADVFILPNAVDLLRQEEVRVATAYHQREHGKFEHSVALLALSSRTA